LAQTLKAQTQSDPGLAKRQAQATQLRAAQAREECIRAALKQLPEVAEVKKRNDSKADARARTTDADARVMKMGDGGLRPAFKVHFRDECACKPGMGVKQRNIAAMERRKRRNFRKSLVKFHYLKIVQPLLHLAARYSEHP
jgi:hypothetical protein